MKKKSILTITALIVMSMLFTTSCDSPMIENLSAILAANDPAAINDLANNPPAQQFTADLLIAELVKYVDVDDPDGLVNTILTATAHQPALVANLITDAKAAPNPPATAITALDRLNAVRNKVIASPAANPPVLMSIEEEAIETVRLMPPRGAVKGRVTHAAIVKLDARISDLESLIIAASNENNPVAADQSIATAKDAFVAAVLLVEEIAFGKAYDSTEDQQMNPTNLKQRSYHELNGGRLSDPIQIEIGFGRTTQAAKAVKAIETQILGNPNGLPRTDTGIAIRIDRAVAAATALIILQSTR